MPIQNKRIVYQTFLIFGLGFLFGWYRPLPPAFSCGNSLALAKTDLILFLKVANPWLVARHPLLLMSIGLIEAILYVSSSHLFLYLTNPLHPSLLELANKGGMAHRLPFLRWISFGPFKHSFVKQLAPNADQKIPLPKSEPSNPPKRLVAKPVRYYLPLPQKAPLTIEKLLLLHDHPKAISNHQSSNHQSSGQEIDLWVALMEQRSLLRALYQKLAETQEAERKQLSSELHDCAGQKLTVLALNLNIIRNDLHSNPSGLVPIEERIADSILLVQQTVDLVRNVLVNLHPPMLDDYGLAATLKWYGDQIAKQTGLQVQVHHQADFPRLAEQSELALFRIVQEALTNIIKHAHASQVAIRLTVDASQVILTIADNGSGIGPAPFNTENRKQSLGLLTMRERAEAIGGRWRIDSKTGEGTRVIVEIARPELDSGTVRQ